MSPCAVAYEWGGQCAGGWKAHKDFQGQKQCLLSDSRPRGSDFPPEMST